MPFIGPFWANFFLIPDEDKVYFRDLDIYIHSSVDGQFDIIADQTVNISTALLQLATVNVSSTLTTSSSLINKTHRITAGVTLDGTYHVLFCDTDADGISVTLPTGIEGTNLKLINCGSSGNDLTVNSASNIYGSTLAQSVSDGEVINIHYNATEGWF